MHCKAEEAAQLLRAQLRSSGPGPRINSPSQGGDDMQLPLLRGRLLDGAKALARDAETAKAAAEREALQLRQVLTDERWKAAAQASVLKAEVEALAGQLAQRAVLYAAQERRWKADERDMGRINMSAVRSSSKVLQPCR